jgi:chlorophyll synthase
MARQAYKSPALHVIPFSAVVELLKPITWFAPMWAFACGVIASGVAVSDRVFEVVIGVLLAGRVPGDWGLRIAVAWTLVSALVAFALGWLIFLAALVGLALAWAYSAPPFRLKLDGWRGNAAVAACYEGLPWFTGAAIMANAMPDWRSILIAVLYSVGAHGIMTLNDFKSVSGDRQMGVRTIPVQLGEDVAARFACFVMAVPQLVVGILLLWWGLGAFAAIVLALLVGQLFLMRRFLQQPKQLAPWYNATGTLLYVLGMLASAFGLAQLTGVS